MKKHLLLLSFCITTVITHAQLGLSGGYSVLNAPVWENAIVEEFGQHGNEDFIGGSTYLAIDYWFRLKNVRIEFLPTLAFRKFDSPINHTISSAIDNRFAEAQFVGFHFNTNFYPFDFGSDCDCPVWSKDKKIFKKGFFIQLSPGVDYVSQVYNFTAFDTQQQQKAEDTGAYFSVGGGIGLDIGLSDFITISPMVGLRYFPNVKWNSLLQDAKTEPIGAAKLTQPFAALRLGFRFDQ